jgi:hypothetical protein
MTGVPICLQADNDRVRRDLLASPEMKTALIRSGCPIQNRGSSITVGDRAAAADAARSIVLGRAFVTQIVADPVSLSVQKE